MPVKVLLRGFEPDIPEDQLVTFSNDLPYSVLCIQCNNVSSKLYRDHRGHGYCGGCKRMCTTENGLNCSTCDQTFRVEELVLDETIRSRISKEMVVCPNSTNSGAIEIPFSALKAHVKGCACHIAFQSLNTGRQDEGIQPKTTNPQVPNKSCGLKTKVECPLCSTLQDRKAVGIHMSEQCPKRVVECNFCQGDVEAWEKKVHEASCRQRPGTCKHCLKQFLTVAELEDEHHPKCPEMPVNCAFHKLGCTFVAARREVPSHELATTHADILVAHICQLKAENESLRRTIQRQEETYKKIIEKMKD